MTNKEFVDKLIKVATKDKTLYVMGCFGAPMNQKNKTRYTQNHPYNRKSDRTSMILSATEDTFGFDCVGLIKGVLWGFSSDESKTYGGAKYESNSVPDINADSLIKLCDSTTDFSTIEIGEAVWVRGHIGVYVGQGRVVECTPKWANNVQITNLGNKPEYKKGNYRVWASHGKLPYVSYESVKDTPAQTHRKYAVSKNDTLWGISHKFLKKGSRYPEIKKLNGLTSDTIRVGQVLKIPNK